MPSYVDLAVSRFYPFKHKPHKMVKPTQTFRQQIAEEMFECVWSFYGICT